jgi:hypothetical protein
VTAPRAATSRDASITTAARVFAAARRDRDQLAAAEGAQAVADAAWYPGSPLSPDAIRDRYEQLQAQATHAGAA